MVFGDSLRTRRETQRHLQDEAARRAALEERSRIAREMHDVVAHHLSLIALQSEAATYQIPGLPDAARARFELLRAMAGEGLVEMRGLLGLLRADPAPRQPVPRLRELPALVDGSRQAGLAVELEVVGCRDGHGGRPSSRSRTGGTGGCVAQAWRGGPRRGSSGPVPRRRGRRRRGAHRRRGRGLAVSSAGGRYRGGVDASVVVAAHGHRVSVVSSDRADLETLADIAVRDC